MLFSLTHIAHDIETFNEVPLLFFERIVDANNFSVALFPEWFGPVINGSPALREKFENVFDVLMNFTREQRQDLSNRLMHDVEIENLCSDQTLIPIYTERDFPEAHSVLKELFTHLYSDTLQKSTLLNNALNTSINDHYIKWKESNVFIVCPFCGLENYTSTDGTNRDSYDHWLCKSKYPLSSINFKNLVPIGEKCNQIAVKGEKDILHSDEHYTRRLSFYPYTGNSGINVSINCVRPPSAGFKGEWTVSFTAINHKEQTKVDTWVEIFNLHERYVSWVKDFLDGWKDGFQKYIAKNQIVLSHDIKNVKFILQNWKNTLLPVEIFSGVLLLEAYIQYLLDDAEDANVFAFCNISLLDA